MAIQPLLPAKRPIQGPTVGRGWGRPRSCNAAAASVWAVAGWWLGLVSEQAAASQVRGGASGRELTLEVPGAHGYGAMTFAVQSGLTLPHEP